MLLLPPLKDYLNDVPDSAFENSSMSKVDDRLVFQLFNWESINSRKFTDIFNCVSN